MLGIIGAWTGLNPIVRKVITWAGIALFALYTLRLWENRIYKKAQEEERQRITRELVDAHQKQMEALREDIKVQRDQLIIETEIIRQAIQRDLQSHMAKWTATSSKLQSSIKDLDAKQSKSNEALMSVPDDGLDAYLRDLSGRLK